MCSLICVFIKGMSKLSIASLKFNNFYQIYHWHGTSVSDIRKKERKREKKNTVAWYLEVVLYLDLFIRKCSPHSRLQFFRFIKSNGFRSLRDKINDMNHNLGGKGRKEIYLFSRWYRNARKKVHKVTCRIFSSFKTVIEWYLF